MERALERVEAALLALRKGKMIILADDESRENEGDLVIAAEKITPQALNFMSSRARGLICLALEKKRVETLGLPLMTHTNHSPFKTAFTLSIDAKEGITTGSSAKDKIHTIKVAISPKTKPGDLVTPGHVFPIKAVERGVLERRGHTEGATDLARISGVSGAAVLSEIMNDDGEMAKGFELNNFAKAHHLPLVSISDLVHYRLYYESIISIVNETTLSTDWGNFNLVTFRDQITQNEHLALIKGKPRNGCLIRFHESCFAGEALGSIGCVCRTKLNESLKRMSQEGSGILFYEWHTYHSCSLKNKNTKDLLTNNLSHLEPYRLAIPSQFLKMLEIDTIKLHTKKDQVVDSLRAFGISIIERPIHEKKDENERELLDYSLISAK
jgi:3,4-dihydroxy 2-butanone 4-phosphate synthase/GTP cyclohydrolase II